MGAALALSGAVRALGAAAREGEAGLVLGVNAVTRALERRAKVFYMDLWRAANARIKLLLVARCGKENTREAAAQARANVQEPLERLARYVGVDPKIWNDRVSISLDELERLIEPRLRRSIRTLSQHADNSC